MSVSEGAHIAAMTVTTLQTLRFDGLFSAFWELVIKAKWESEVQDPELPRRRKMPHRFGGALGDFPTDCKAHTCLSVIF